MCPSFHWSHILNCLMRHPVLNVISTINCFSPKIRCQVLGMNHAISHTILLRGVWNKILMKNAMFFAKILKCLANIFLPLSVRSFLMEHEDCFSRRALNVLKVAKTSLLCLRKYTQEYREKSSIKVNAYLAPKKGGVEIVIRSLCTNSRGAFALEVFPLGKGSWCCLPRHNLYILHQYMKP